MTEYSVEIDTGMWQEVCSEHPGDYLERIRVPGGWIYRSFIDPALRRIANESLSPCMAMVFVPLSDK